MYVIGIKNNYETNFFTNQNSRYGNNNPIFARKFALLGDVYGWIDEHVGKSNGHLVQIFEYEHIEDKSGKTLGIVRLRMIVNDKFAEWIETPVIQDQKPTLTINEELEAKQLYKELCKEISETL